MSTWVLLRGLTRERGHWGTFPDRLSAVLGASVVALDLAGNGQRHGVPSPARIEALAADVDTQVRRLGLVEAVSVLALSLGAMVAVAWARAASVALERQVLVSTSLRPFAPLHWRMRPAAAAQLGWHLVRGAPRPLEAAVLRFTSAGADPAVLAHWLRLRQQHPVSRTNALRQLLAAARFAVVDPPVVPTLLLAGRGDRLVDPRCSERIAAAWRCRLALHPTAGHDLPLDAPDWVIEQVRAWVADATHPAPAAGHPAHAPRV
jgi:pimeloyl-ACP methyl ester carboxylesterase